MIGKIADAYRGKTVLISGGLGYLGSALAESLAGIDCRLILLDQPGLTRWRPKASKAKILISYGDVSAYKTWKSVLPGVDYLFHLAALEYDRVKYDILRDLKVNALSVMHFLELCRKNNLCPKIIFSSSANLFGLVDKLPVNEKARSSPASLWSVHKLMAENYLSVYAKKYGIGSVTLRLTNIFGLTANQDTITRVVINNMIARALRREALVLYANRNCIRDYLFIDDAVQAFLLAGAGGALKYAGDFYIVGSSEGKTIAEVWQLIADKVKAITGKNIPVEFDGSAKLEPFDMRNFTADTKLFRQATGWKPRVCFDRGVELTIEALISMKKGKGIWDRLKKKKT